MKVIPYAKFEDWDHSFLTYAVDKQTYTQTHGNSIAFSTFLHFMTL